MKSSVVPAGEYPLQISWRTFAYKNRKLFMTREGIFFSLIILGVGIAAINTGINLLYLIFAMTCSFMVLAGVLSEYCVRKMSCQVSSPQRVFAGEDFPVTVKLINRKKRLPSFSLRISLGIAGTEKRDEFYLHRVLPESSSQKTLLMSLDARGRYSLERPELSTRFPFNFGVKSRLLDCGTSFVVFPKLQQEEKIFQLLNSSFGGERRRQQRSYRGEFAGSRQFQSGDNMKFINWKASAKGENLYVKEFEISEAKTLRIFFDNSRSCSPEAFEEKVSLAASLVFYSSGWGYKIHLMTAERDFPSIDSEAMEYEVLAYLAEVRQIPSQNTKTEPFPKNESYIRL